MHIICKKNNIFVLFLGTGPASGALCTKFGSRAVMMVGGAIFAGGNLMAAASPSVGILILSNGFVSGQC